MILLLAAGSSSSLSDVTPGLLGFLVVAGLAVALVFLLRSMNKQFRKIGPDPEDTEETSAAAADEARDGEAAAVAEDEPAGQGAPRSARPGAAHGLGESPPAE